MEWNERREKTKRKGCRSFLRREVEREKRNRQEKVRSFAEQPHHERLARY